MMNFSLDLWLKQRRWVVGGVLFAIVITACSTSVKSQLRSINTLSSVNPSIASSPPLSPTSSQPLPPTSRIQSKSSSAAGSRTQSLAELEPQQQEAVQVIRDYYNAIDRRNYEQAYSAWEVEGAANQQSFEEFKQGFTNTASVAVTVGEPGRIDGAVGSLYIKIPVTVTATTTSGTSQRFRGSYVLRRVNDVPGSTPEQRQWHFYSANLTVMTVQ
jgi:hypothetical protein